MRTRSERVFWAVLLLSICAGSYLSARLASLYISKLLWVPEDVESDRSRLHYRPAKPESLSDYGIITERALFAKPPLLPSPPPLPAVAAQPVLPPPPRAFPSSDSPTPAGRAEPVLELKVVGTAVLEGGRSFALIASGPEVRAVKEREEIVPGAVLLAVHPNKIRVSWRGRTEEFPLFERRPSGEPELASARNAPRRRLPAARAQSPSPSAATQDTVVQRDEDTWVVDSRELERVKSDMPTLMSQIRVAPNFTNGESDGFKIFAVRPGSIFAKMGLQNGDVIKSINGLQIQGVQQAFEAYQLLQNETRITVDLVRKNANRSLTYEIR
ncbi:MAG: PDZ domain-containing protein [Deltaproteobacteria bacterium]|nr:PDZ domain-containing protein [Deltaproteobacteria bacterium]